MSPQPWRWWTHSCRKTAMSMTSVRNGCITRFICPMHGKPRLKSWKPWFGIRLRKYNVIGRINIRRKTHRNLSEAWAWKIKYPHYATVWVLFCWLLLIWRALRIILNTRQRLTLHHFRYGCWWMLYFSSCLQLLCLLLALLSKRSSRQLSFCLKRRAVYERQIRWNHGLPQ